MPRERQAVAELKRCLCEEQAQYIKYMAMTKDTLKYYGVASETERQKGLARARGARNAYIKALRLLGVDNDAIHSVLEGVKVTARGEFF